MIGLNRCKKDQFSAKKTNLVQAPTKEDRCAIVKVNYYVAAGFPSEGDNRGVLLCCEIYRLITSSCSTRRGRAAGDCFRHNNEQIWGLPSPAKQGGIKNNENKEKNLFHTSYGLPDRGYAAADSVGR